MDEISNPLDEIVVPTPKEILAELDDVGAADIDAVNCDELAIPVGTEDT